MRRSFAALALCALACRSHGKEVAGETTAAGTDTAGEGADAGADGADGGGDSAGDPDADGDGVPASEDCDDTDPTVAPGAEETCDGEDEDCDGEVDEDAIDAGTWYPDGDGDGWGTDADAVADCAEALDGYAMVGGDCDDSDPAVNPGAVETWYDGVDTDCGGGSDFDADGDGSDAVEYGGGDCDDSDPTVYEGVGCRPPVTCSAPSVATLQAYAPAGAADLAFDGACNAYITTIVGGGDRLVYFDSSGAGGSLAGPSDWDMSAVTFDPTTGGAVVGFSSTQAVGVEVAGALSTVAASGGEYVTYGSGVYSNGYLNDSPPSLAMDTSGCIWTPNWANRGTLACVETDGTTTTYELSEDTAIMAVGLDASETLFVAIGDTLSSYDPVADSLTTVWTGGGDILDFTIDFDDSFYVETGDDALTHVSADGATSTVLETVTGDARLAISPDGVLVRMMGAPTGSATFSAVALE